MDKGALSGREKISLKFDHWGYMFFVGPFQNLCFKKAKTAACAN
jgi:hypothetical protein